jgi:hypothetical protein
MRQDHRNEVEPFVSHLISIAKVWAGPGISTSIPRRYWAKLPHEKLTLSLIICLVLVAGCIIRPTEDHIVIKEGTVAFITISDQDRNVFLSKHPGWEEGIVENLSDFMSYSSKISELLKPAGINSIFASPKILWFQYPNGKSEKIEVNHVALFGIAMFGKGRTPRYTTEFGANLQPMSAVVSEYFEIDLDVKKKPSPTQAGTPS